VAKKIGLIVPLFFLLGALTGCSDETASYRFEIKSDTNWRAEYYQVGHDQDAVLFIGDGNKTVDLSWDPPVCIEANNLHAGGYIEVLAIKHVTKYSAIFRQKSEEDIVQDKERMEGPIATVGACTQ
jgi:hypothetical protein